jgi:hypothetical protein
MAAGIWHNWMTGVSPSTVGRIWRKFEIKPHLI